MSYSRLSAAEREKISVGLEQGMSLRALGRELDRAPSTVLREVNRFKHKWPTYRPILSHYYAVKSAAHRKLGKRKLVRNKEIQALVEAKLKLYWSPEQIETHLKLHYKSDMQISKESIYTYLYVFMRRNMREEFTKCLRQGRKRRHKQNKTNKDPSYSRELGKIELIDERPAEANDRLIPGHWEGDLIIGSGREQTALGTLVERTTRFLILVPLKNKSANEVREQFAKAINQLPQRLKRSLTYDQGREMAQHRLFTEQTEMKVFFAHPRSPWERGTNENTNGLVRQYFPKNTDFRSISEEEIQRVQDQLNGRPRKTLGWLTPAEKMNEVLQ